MNSAREHPDTADEPYTGILARLAIALTALTIIFPALAVVLR